MSTRPTLRVRKSGAVLIAAGIAIVGAVPLAGASRALAPIILIPIAVFLWAWRAGTDVYADQVKVRALVGGSRVPWSRIVELAPDERGRVSALLDNGNVLRLTGVTRDNLQMVLAAGGQPVAPERPAGKRATAEHPAPADPAAADPAPAATAAAPPATDHPAPARPATEAPPAAQPAHDHPAAAQPAPEQPAAGGPASERPAAAAPPGALPAERRVAGEHPAEERPDSDH